MTPTLSPEALEQANEAFYRTFEALDLEAMGHLWEDSERVFCVHPGWQALKGRGPVMESWEVILANTTQIRFTLTGVEARVIGEVGVVTLHENIISQVSEERHTATAVSTNLFAWHGQLEGWKLFHHHASLTTLHEDEEGMVS